MARSQSQTRLCTWLHCHVEKILSGLWNREWNNEDIKNIHCDFFHEALESEYWAFASDYLRLYALKQFGGFYFDTDLELTNSLDSFLDHDLVLGFEKNTENLARIETAFMGSKPRHPTICDWVNYYETHHFRHGNKFDLTPNSRIFTKYFRSKLGVKSFSSSSLIELSATEKIYPHHYFCTPESGLPGFAIHHFDRSWIKDFYRIELLKLGSFRLLRFKKNNLQAHNCHCSKMRTCSTNSPTRGVQDLLF